MRKDVIYRWEFGWHRFDENFQSKQRFGIAEFYLTLAFIATKGLVHGKLTIICDDIVPLLRYLKVWGNFSKTHRIFF